MAYTINTGGVMEILFTGHLFGQQVMNTFHYKYEGPVIASGLVFLQNMIQTNPQMQANMAQWQNCISSDVENNRVYGQWIYPLRYRAFNAPMAAPTGTAGACNTANTASVVTLVSDRASRHGVGNKHLPGLPVTSQLDGALIPAQITTNDIFGIAMRASVPILGGLMRPIIYNRADPAASFEVSGHEVNTLVRVQRRRTVGLGK